MRTFIPFAIVIVMSTLVAEAPAQVLPEPQAVTDPKQISSKPNAQVEPRSLTIEKLYMTRQVGRSFRGWMADAAYSQRSAAGIAGVVAGWEVDRVSIRLRRR